VPFTIPAAPLRLVAREMADEMLLVSQRVQPQVLLSSGYKFQHPELKAALQQLL
jgi:NAD dependent epimerase/dehydratase family enzyme